MIFLLLLACGPTYVPGSIGEVIFECVDPIDDYCLYPHSLDELPERTYFCARESEGDTRCGPPGELNGEIQVWLPSQYEAAWLESR